MAITVGDLVEFKTGFGGRWQPCCSCGAAAPSDPHHAGSRGVGQKADDYATVPLCRRCHDVVTDTNVLPGRTREETTIIILRAQVALLADRRSRRRAGAAGVRVVTAVAVELVPFRGGTIEGLMHDGRPWAVLRSVCAGLGITEEQQAVKLRRKPWATTALIAAVAADGRQRQMLCLDLDSLPMWLATIEPSRVKPEARDALVAYQREAAQVLRDHFLGRGTPPAGAVSTVDIAPLVAEVEALRKAVLSAQMRPALNRSEINEVAREVALRVAAAQKAAAEESAPLATTAEMAERLGVSARTFTRWYSTNLHLRALAVDSGRRRGAGTELHWPAAEVAALLGITLRPLRKGGNA